MKQYMRYLIIKHKIVLSQRNIQTLKKTKKQKTWFKSKTFFFGGGGWVYYEKPWFFANPGAILKYAYQSLILLSKLFL